ncbi:MAG TPA: YfiR family protein [Candidatus Methylacidiphilales bacterium]|nr:YfiR family protein [Candidatus Methylacidiphilales bacterium]
MEFLGFPFQGPRPKGCPKSRHGSPLPKLRRHFFVLGFLALCLAAGGQGSIRAQSDSAKEYQIKAAFLFNFTQFVKWPDNSFPSPDAPFDIGILGDDPFGPALEETIRGEEIENHRLTVVHAQRIEDLEGCQVIFVSRSEESHVGEILSQLDSRPILTVSEVDSFARDGGDIDFYLANGRVRFEINPHSAQRCGLKISSQLLTLGKIVDP